MHYKAVISLATEYSWNKTSASIAWRQTRMHSYLVSFSHHLDIDRGHWLHNNPPATYGVWAIREPLATRDLEPIGSFVCLCRVFVHENHPEISYDIFLAHTVDAFQGGEAPVVILDLTFTDHAGFMREPSRLNVSLSRAQCGSYVLCAAQTFMRATRRNLAREDGSRLGHQAISTSSIAEGISLSPKRCSFDKLIKP